MGPDAGLVEEAAALAAAPGASLGLSLLGESFRAESASVSRAPAPVSGPTSRGGAYVAGPEEYRARVRVAGRAVVGLMPRAMLGPSGEFADAEITARPAGGGPGVLLRAHPKSVVEGPSYAELSLTVVSAERI